MIIDAHGHLGNILYPGGGETIFIRDVAFPASRNLARWEEDALYRDSLPIKALNAMFPYWLVGIERSRNFAATLQNFQASLAGTEIVRSVCAPIAPNITYSDLKAAREADNRVVAFTSPDFTAKDMTAKLIGDLKDGASGIKIHPILQEINADDHLVMEAVEAAAPFRKPVLLHAGMSRYYTFWEHRRDGKGRFRTCASIGKIDRLIAAFPETIFIVGHAGLREIAEVIGSLTKYRNTFADTSFQSPEAIKALVSSFGGERVLFASDWPYGSRLPMIRTAKAACGGDAGLEKAVFYENAVGLGLNAFDNSPTMSYHKPNPSAH